MHPTNAGSRLAALLLATLVAAGCATDPGSAPRDPFADLDGKTDGAGDFFRTEGWVLRFDSERERVQVEGLGREGRYDDVEWLEHGDRSERLRLDRGDRLAGMRSFLLVDADAGEWLGRARVMEAAGLEVPRAVVVRWQVDDVDLGERLLVEHVGDRFLRDRFDDDEGELLRTPEESDALHAALGLGSDARELVGQRAIGATFDAESLGRAAAAAAALGEIPLSFYELEGIGHVAIPEEASFAVSAEPLHAALRHLAVRAAYVLALPDLIECLSDVDCGGDVSRSNEVANDLADELARHELADAPDGYAFYASRRVLEDGRFEIAYRNLDVFAVAVDARLDGIRTPLVHDSERDLWTGVFEIVAPTEPDFVVTDYDGGEHEQLDPTGLGAIDPAAVDVLRELYRTSLEVGEPSGLATWNERLFVVGDEDDDVYEIDPTDGGVLDRIDVNVRGMEGLSIDRRTGELLVADEDRGEIIRFDFEGNELGREHFGWAEDDADGGIEGLAVRPSDGHVFFAKERSPVRLAELDPHGDLLRREDMHIADDISAVAVDPTDGRLYVLSDQAQTLYRLDAEWNVQASWPLDVDKPEGLVVEGGRVYVVSDLRHELVAYELGR